MSDCDGCKFWSELMVNVTAGEAYSVEAMCLNPESPHHECYVNRGCKEHSPGRAIDDPSPVAGDIE